MDTRIKYRKDVENNRNNDLALVLDTITKGHSSKYNDKDKWFEHALEIYNNSCRDEYGRLKYTNKLDKTVRALIEACYSSVAEKEEA